MSYARLRAGAARLFGQAGNFQILVPGDEWNASGSHLCALDPNTGKISSLRLPVELAHSVFVNPRQSHLAVVMGQHERMSLVDLREMREILSVRAAGEPAYFYGHGAFTPDGGYFYTSEVWGGGNEGRISIRRADTLAVVDEMPSYGVFPHDFLFLADGHTLAIANHGQAARPGKPLRPSSLTYVDTRSKKFLGEVKIPEPGAYASHLFLLGGDELVVACRKQTNDGSPDYLRLSAMLADPATHLRAAKEIWKYMKYVPAPMYWIKGEKILREEKFGDFYPHALNTLSLAYAPKLGLLAITHVEGKMISLWNVKERKMVKALLPGFEPRGICVGPEGKDFAVSFTEGFLQYVDGDSLELVAARKFPMPFGVHMASARF